MNRLRWGLIAVALLTAASATLWAQPYSAQIQAALNSLSSLVRAPGTANYFFGAAGNATLSGINNIAIGTSGTLDALTSGEANIAIGTNACGSITNATGCIGIGLDANALGTGADEIAIGNSAGKGNGAHGGNVYIGANAGEQATASTNSGNVGIGKFALNANTTGPQNTAIGRAALFDLNIINGTDGNNTALGYNTGRGITTGKENTILGAQVTGLGAALSNNIIIAQGAGVIKAQHDNTRWVLNGTGNRTAQTTAPTCTSNCGTSPSITGTDNAMTVTMGATGVPASGWVVTFNGTWSSAPACSIQMGKAGMVVGKQVLTAVTTATTITAVTNGTAPATADVYNIVCW